MSSQGGHSRRSQKRAPSTSKKSTSSENGNLSKPTSPQPPSSVGGERTVKKLRLSKALTIPEGTIVSDACRRMTARRVDAVLLTDANALLSGIVTDKDIATRVIAEGLRPDQTIVSKIMTRNPIFVTSDSLAIDALQKMIQGKFRHLPVVENGEVIAILDIAKCLYDAISRMEKAAEQGSAIAAAVEGVERQWGSDFSAQCAFIETLRERMFKPALSTIITENAKVAIVSPSDPVYVAAKKMREMRCNSVIIVTGNRIQGILTSKDVLMRVVAQNLSPELTLVEKVMTSNPECATVETTILDALHIMHDGKFLHLPVIDKDGGVAACLDVLQITHAAISMVESGSGAVNDMTNTMMQKFWDSALALEPPEDYDTQSEMSALMTSEGAEQGKFTYPSLGLGNSFAFKFQDLKGRVHRFNCGTENVDELLSTVMQRIGAGNDGDRPQLLYEDDEGDKVLLTTDADLVGAISHARSVGLKVLRLHLDYSESSQQTKSELSTALKPSKVVVKNPSASPRVPLASPRLSVSPKPSIIRISSLNSRKNKSLKVVSPLKNQGKIKKAETEQSKNELKQAYNDSVHEETLYVIKMETENKSLESDQNASCAVESAPYPSFSLSKCIPISPSSLLQSVEDQEQSEYTETEAEDDYFSESEYEESISVEGEESLCGEHHGKPKKNRMIHPEDKDSQAMKLYFRRGKIVDIQSESNNPRRLKFRRGKVLCQNQNLKADGRRSFKKIAVDDEMNDSKPGSEKVVLRHQDVQGKKDSQVLFNNVIEQTASKLVETRKSKVKALVGAFETVISLQESKPSANTVT